MPALTDVTTLDDVTAAPLAFDTAKADEILGKLAVNGKLRDVMHGAAGSSPYLARLISMHGAWVLDNRDTDIGEVLSSIRAGISTETLDHLMKDLRRAKARTALVLALADLGRAWPTMEITRALTEFADFATQLAMEMAISEAIRRKKLPEAAREDCGGLFALAMGKQGAYELNYSSDIDLILLYDETRWADEDMFTIRKGFVRAAQTMVKILSDRTAEGYVFRTDLRLRPDPSVTPVVIATDQAESYYEALGRTWERAAFIKARACAGDIEAGARFIAALKPFIWRKYLDFAAIQDAHNMRLRIRAHKGLTHATGFEGAHLKLGRGGIREIEFFAQTRQLIFGGRDPELRQQGTLAALDALAGKGIIPPELRDQMHADYVYLRDLEHRAQMIDDQQVHSVPEGGDNLKRFLALSGSDDRDQFAEDFLTRSRALDSQIEAFFEGSESEQDDIDPDFQAEIQDVAEGWLSLPALRSDRARVIFDRLRPRIFSSLAQSVRPKEALQAFDRFLRTLPAGVQVFSLFDANPSLMDLLVEICSIAPAEARVLGENARIFEAVLLSDFYRPMNADEAQRDVFNEMLDIEFAQVTDFEEALDAARRFTREAHFRIAVHLLRDLVTFDLASQILTLIADCVILRLIPFAEAEVARRHGPAPGNGAAVLGMGKLGSREMTLGSDLDLIVIYDAAGATMSEGKRPISPSAWYAKFTQTLISALTAPTAEGGLFEVDMRLRPSGHQGPVATAIGSFKSYQAREAWVWEHMALLRARVVAGPEALKTDIETAIGEALERPRETGEIEKSVADMRARLAVAKADPSPFALKNGRGRLMDIELYAQGLTLLHGEKTGGQRMKTMLGELAERRAIDATTAEKLTDAHHQLFGLQQLARLSFGGDPPSSHVPAGWLMRQADFSGARDEATLARHLADIADSAGEIIDDAFPASEA